MSRRVPAVNRLEAARRRQPARAKIPPPRLDPRGHPGL